MSSQRASPTGRSGAGRNIALYTLKEAAEFLRLHPRTVREYVRRGELKGRIIGGRYRFRREDLDAFVDKAPATWEFYVNSDREE